MKRAWAFVCLLVLAVSLVAAPAKGQSPEQLLDKVWKKLGADHQGLPVRLRLHVSDKDELNAWTTPRTGDIYISKKMLSLIGSSEGELAFILGHEIGHVMGHWTGLSMEAQGAQLKADLSGFLSRLNLLFESEEDRKNRYSHVEEKLADALGLFLLKEAGYNLYDAGAFFGRLQMLAGTTDPWTRIWEPYLSAHPFNEDRIEGLRQIMAQLQEAEGKSPEEGEEDEEDDDE